MAKLFPKKQQLISSDLADGDMVAITRVKILTTNDNVDLPGTAIDAALLQSTKTASDPTFYLYDNDSQLNIDGATAGTEFVVVSRHAGNTNYLPGENTEPNRPR